MAKKKSILDKVKDAFKGIPNKKESAKEDGNEPRKKSKAMVGSYNEMLAIRRENAKQKMQRINANKDKA